MPPDLRMDFTVWVKTLSLLVAAAPFICYVPQENKGCVLDISFPQLNLLKKTKNKNIIRRQLNNNKEYRSIPFDLFVSLLYPLSSSITPHPENIFLLCHTRLRRGLWLVIACFCHSSSYFFYNLFWPVFAILYSTTGYGSTTSC